MIGEERKAAVAAYKERKVAGGVYAIRCDASGDIWVGQWSDIETIQTRIWFALRQGIHPRPDLLASWRQYGEVHFSFEVIEKIETDASPYIRDKNLKERALHWRIKLNAKAM
ncbi:GIY-YIG nuclease family protein [Pseudochelatococcus sp. B33]